MKLLTRSLNFSMERVMFILTVDRAFCSKVVVFTHPDPQRTPFIMYMLVSPSEVPIVTGSQRAK